MSAPRAEVLLENATFLTQVAAAPRAAALAIAGGRILAVGSPGEVAAHAGPATRRVDLGGATVTPGFFDAHTHVWKVGQLRTRVLDLRETRSLAELSRQVAAAAARDPGGWVEGRGYNEALLAEGRRPVAADLEAAAPGRRVFLTRTCGHIGVASPAALRAGGVDRDTPAPPGGTIVRDEAGAPTGELLETAMGLVRRNIPPPDAAALREMVLAAGAHLVARGITSATDAGVSPALLDVYRRLDADGSLPLRMHPMAIRSPLDGAPVPDLPEVTVTEGLRIDTVKLFADGGLSGATAALSRPYKHADDRGLLRLDRAGLVELGRDAHARGLRIGVHAIGDAAIDETLAAFEELQEDGRAPGHRIEHCGLPGPEQLARAARLGLAVTPQAIFLPELGANFRRFLDEAYLARCYPLRSMLDAGLTVALSSDAPVVRDDAPLRGIQAAVLRGDPGEADPIAPAEAITAAEALEAYTRGGARAAGEDASRGRLAPGLLADLAVLSADPTTTDPAGLHEIRVEATWIGGAPVYERGTTGGGT